MDFPVVGCIYFWCTVQGRVRKKSYRLNPYSLRFYSSVLTIFYIIQKFVEWSFVSLMYSRFLSLRLPMWFFRVHSSICRNQKGVVETLTYVCWHTTSPPARTARCLPDKQKQLDSRWLRGYDYDPISQKIHVLRQCFSFYFFLGTSQRTTHPNGNDKYVIYTLQLPIT